MKCPKCGAIPHHYLRSSRGDNYYECTTGLTSFEMDGSRISHINPCDTILDQWGKVFKGTVAFISNGKTKAEKIGG